MYDFSIDLDARKLAAITIVAGGYGGDIPEDQTYDLLDDIDFYYNKVKCSNPAIYIFVGVYLKISHNDEILKIFSFFHSSVCASRIRCMVSFIRFKLEGIRIITK